MRRITFGVALAMSLGTAILPVGQASAAAPPAGAAASTEIASLARWSNCNESVMCMFHKKNGNSVAYKLRTRDANFANNKFSDDHKANDAMKSYWNRSGRTYCFWVNKNYKPANGPFRVLPGRRGNFPQPWYNDISSARPC